MMKIKYSAIQKKAHQLKRDPLYRLLMYSDDGPAKYNLMSWQNAVMHNMTTLG